MYSGAFSLIFPLFICVIVTEVNAFSVLSPINTSKNKKLTSSTALSMGLTLYGHPGTRSPLVNWACHELGADFVMAKDLSKNPHPFGQLPCLTDDEGVLVFESGAILQYLQNNYANQKGKMSAAEVSAITSWITWANASLDPICFLETPEGKVYDTGLKNPDNRRLKQLNNILAEQDFLVQSAGFTLADVAVSSYLLYVLLFFSNILEYKNGMFPKQYPAIVRYMKDCVSRPTYGQAFGEDVQVALFGRLQEALP